MHMGRIYSLKQYKKHGERDVMDFYLQAASRTKQLVTLTFQRIVPMVSATTE